MCIQEANVFDQWGQNVQIQLQGLFLILNYLSNLTHASSFYQLVQPHPCVYNCMASHNLNPRVV